MKYQISLRLHRALVFLMILLSQALSAQSDPWSGWDSGVIMSLKSAGDTEYNSDEEKKVILFMNMARYDGPLFANTFLESYIEEKKLDNSSYIRSLKRDLKKVSGLSPLVAEKDLTAIAQGHARKSGEKGTTGHSGFKERFEPLMGHPYNHVGESCSYGYEKAIDIVISLLIDDGIKGLGHRKNILSPDFNSIGVAIRPHKTFRVNCVMDFGSRDRSSMNNLPF